MTTRDEIGLTEADHSVTAQDIRAAIDMAIELLHVQGRPIHTGNIRPLLPEWATGPQFGARMTGHVRRGSLKWNGKFALNGNRKTRNALRPCKVYELVKPLKEAGA